MPVVCLHGATSQPSTWDRFADDVAPETVVALPLLGHADADRPGRYPISAFRDDVLRRIDALGIDRCALVGHSLGGLTATLLAQAVPERVEALVLEDIPVPPRLRDDASPVERWAALRMRLAGLIPQRSFDRRVLGDVIGDLATPRPAWWDALARLTMPVLVITGGTSSHVSQEAQQALAAALPNAELVEIPAGHRVHSLAPAAFADVVVPFLRRR